MFVDVTLSYAASLDANMIVFSSEANWQMFPVKGKEKEQITCHDLTDDFLIYGTDVRFPPCFFL